MNITTDNSSAGWEFPVFTWDGEIFPNFSLIGFRDLVSGAVRQFSNGGVGEDFAALRRWFDTVKGECFFIGFNSWGYDNVIARAIICDKIDDAARLYKLSRETIDAEFVRVVNIDGQVNFDLLQLYGGKRSKLGSLKECGVKMGFRRLQELPFAYDADLASRHQMLIVAEYNELDFEITALVAQASKEIIEAQWALSIEYGVHVYSLHKVALAKQIMASQLFDDYPEYPLAEQWVVSGQTLTQGFGFQHPEIVALVERINAWNLTFRVEHDTVKDKKSLKGDVYSDALTIDGVGYTVGIGGLHSVDAAGIYEADENWRLIDFDVDSFYPAIMINHNLAPAHLDKAAFVAAFDRLRQARLAAKRAGRKQVADGLKT